MLTGFHRLLLPRRLCPRARRKFSALGGPQSGDGGRESEPQSTTGEQPRSISIKSWDAIGSLADAYAIIRAVERKYGRIREYQFWRDSERPQILQSRVTAVFRSPESYWRVPPQGEVLHIPAPQTDPNREGGIGLDDIQGLLESQDMVEEEELPGWGSIMNRVLQSEKDEASMRMLDVKVMRASRNWQYASSIVSVLPTRARLLRTGYAFTEWGGFFFNDNVKSNFPITSSTAHNTSESSTGPLPKAQSSERGRMREAMVKWKRFIGREADSKHLDSEVKTNSTTESPFQSHLAHRWSGVVNPNAPTPSETLTPASVEWEPIPDIPTASDVNTTAMTTFIPVFETEIPEHDLPRPQAQKNSYSVASFTKDKD